MQKFLAFILAILFALTLSGPATAATLDYNPNVGAVTCSPEEDSCVVDFIGNAGNGYWTLQRSDSLIAVRVTLVPGWTTYRRAPITCTLEDTCILDFVGLSSSPAGAYWRARYKNSSNWVRLSMVQGQ